MQYPESWLRHFCDPPIGNAELVDRLTMAGLEVESNDPVAPPFSGVVVGRVLSIARHPDAERLTVCQVDDGSGTTLNIVCGAPNVAAGQRVPCARVGAVLPGGLEIKSAKMRGVTSQGMLCAADELGITDDHSGLLLLADDAPIGSDVRDVLRLDDRCLTIKLTPNRGDCLSIVGVAREIAALTGAALRQPDFTPVSSTIDERLPVSVLAPDLCGRFSGRVIRGLNAKAPTPAWMRERLERAGQRPISALVDISNYVMLELGRPSHVFDLDKVRGTLEVRWGRADALGKGEAIELLNGQTVEADAQVGVIADAGGVEALAGIMGGEATAVSLDTANVYVEAAFWWPEAIQGRSRRFNFATDAGHRFERGVDFATTVDHIEYITRLLIDICGTAATKVGPIDDQAPRLPDRAPVAMRISRCRRVLGVPIGADEMVDCLQRLRLAPTRESDCITVVPPSYRFDLAIEEDLIEEVARLWGFERIPAKPPRAAAAMRAQPEGRRTQHTLRAELAGAGYQELINFSFVDPQWERDFCADENPIRVVNPIASQMAVMRSSLIGGLMATLKYNLNRKAARVRLFEVGRVFLRDAEAPAGPLSVGGLRQPIRIAALAYGPAVEEQWGATKRDVDFYDIKGDLERLGGGRLGFAPIQHPAMHPGRCAEVRHGDRAIGVLGELHPRWQQKYELPKPAILFEVDTELLLELPIPVARPVPRVQPLFRDLALWFAAEVSFGQIEAAVDTLRRTDERLAHLSEFRLFDLYRPDAGSSSKVAGVNANALLSKEKSLAFRIVLSDTERTLNDADADAAINALTEGLNRHLGARSR